MELKAHHGSARFWHRTKRNSGFTSFFPLNGELKVQARPCALSTLTVLYVMFLRELLLRSGTCKFNFPLSKEISN